MPDSNKVSFTRTVNVTVFVIDTSDLFDGHVDRQNKCATHINSQIVCHH